MSYKNNPRKNRIKPEKIFFNTLFYTHVHNWVQRVVETYHLTNKKPKNQTKFATLKIISIA